MESQASVASQVDAPQSFTAPIGADTTFRCLLSLFIVRAGMRFVIFGSKVLSPTHPARSSYGGAVVAWRDRTRLLPWRGFVPTDRRAITVTQAVWLALALMLADTVLYLLNMPYVPLYGLLHRYVPHLSVHFVQPGHSTHTY